MTRFTAKIVFEGANGKTRPRYFDLGDFTTGTPGGDYDAAVSAITQIAGAFGPVTDAAIRKVELTGIVSEDTVTPGGGDVYENALVNTYLDAGGVKQTQLYWPAPAIGIFQGAAGAARDKLDITNADVIQLVQQYSQHAFVSDGEQIDTTIQNGIDSGYRSVQTFSGK